MRRRGQVFLVRDPDVTILDDQTLEHECACGDVLDLPHLYDWDREQDWYGGRCMRCSDQIEVFIIPA